MSTPKNLVLITSVIFTSQNSLSYTNTRSVFTPEQRFSQTIDTISSCRKMIPDCHIMFVEGSDLSSKSKLEYQGIGDEQSIKGLVDIYINLSSNQDAKKIIDSPLKSYGEATIIMNALNYLFENNLTYQNFFKISGRYFLDDKFDYNVYNNDKIIAKAIYGNKHNINTTFYKIPFSQLKDYLSFMKDNIQLFLNGGGHETIFPLFVNSKDNSVFIDVMGINGYVSVCGSTFSG